MDELELTLRERGPDAAIDQLIDQRRQAGDATGLFYAMLMKARWQLGVDPMPTRPTTEMPEQFHEQYEAAIREAGRAAGQLCLNRNDPARAWGFFRLLNEPETYRNYLATYRPGEEDDVN